MSFVPIERWLTSLCLSIVFVLLTAEIVEAQTGYKEVEVKNGARIFGLVKLGGNTPSLQPFPITKNTEHCGTVKPSDRLIVGKKQGVKNAIISLEGINQGKKFAAYAKPTLDQQNCEYTPHVQVLPLGSDLDIVNSDDILHNVHGYAVAENYRTVCNIAQPIKGQRTAIRRAHLSRPGLILMTCDAGHPWMSAYILVAEHPYYTVTDEEGSFELLDVPPGSYKIKMWHEGVKVVARDLEKGVVKKYHYEESYETIKEINVLPGKDLSTDFELFCRD